jgi:hypothetical protein
MPLTGAVKLGASDCFNSRGVLYNNGSGNKKSNAGRLFKFGQRNIKLQYRLADTHLNARWGWQTMKNFGVISNSTASPRPPIYRLERRGELRPLHAARRVHRKRDGS